MGNLATYEVDIRGAGNGVASSSAQVNVNGSLDFVNGGAGIRIWNCGYVFTAGSQYTIATADTINGSFDANLTNADISPFLHFVLGQDATSVFLTVERSATLASAAETPNQKAAAGWPMRGATLRRGATS